MAYANLDTGRRMYFKGGLHLSPQQHIVFYVDDGIDGYNTRQVRELNGDRVTMLVGDALGALLVNGRVWEYLLPIEDGIVLTFKPAHAV